MCFRAMRPDKKKVRHHDSRKAAARNKQEAAAKSKQGGPRPAKAEEQPAGDEGRDREEDDGAGGGYGKRSLASNWDKYDLPPSDGDGDEEGSGMTGEDFNYVLQHASTSDALLRLRAEKEWDEAQTLVSEDNTMFAVDLEALEAAVAAVPLHKQLDIEPKFLNVSHVFKIFLSADAKSLNKN